MSSSAAVQMPIALIRVNASAPQPLQPAALPRGVRTSTGTLVNNPFLALP